MDEMKEQPQKNYQVPTIHDLDRAMVRRAMFEVAGLAILALAILLIWVKVVGWGWKAFFDGLFVVTVVELIVLGLSFLLKEPAIERIAKSVLATARTAWQRRQTQKSVPVVRDSPEVIMRTTNQADQDYNAAFDALEASLKALAKLADGETLKTKPWARRALVAGKIIKDDYAQWSRVMSLWERAGIIESRDATTIKVMTLQQGRTMLKAQMERDGYILINDTWMKK